MAKTTQAALGALEVVERILAGVEQAEWSYNQGIDEMEIYLPGSEGHAGEAVLVGDDVYVRLDIATHAPLSIIIPAYTFWLGSQPPPPFDPRKPPEPRHWPDLPRQMAAEALKRIVRERAQDFAAALEN